jgi:actin-related protein
MHSMVSAELGGQDMLDYLLKILNERGYSYSSQSEREICRDIKHKLAYVALDFDKEMKTPDHELMQNYELPDGGIISLGNERFRCAEAMFQPSLLGWETKGLHRMVYDCLEKTHPNLTSELYSNIILVGGNTMFIGFAERLQKELKALVPASRKVKVVAPPERQKSAWIGGSILASLSTFQQMFMKRADYKEHGPRIVNFMGIQ